MSALVPSRICKLNNATTTVKEVSDILSFTKCIQPWLIVKYITHRWENGAFNFWFCRTYYKMYIWCNYLTSIIHLYGDNFLHPIGWLTLYGLTERIMNEWVRQFQIFCNMNTKKFCIRFISYICIAISNFWSH
jgi:hypothetical protein